MGGGAYGNANSADDVRYSKGNRRIYFPDLDWGFLDAHTGGGGIVSDFRTL